MEPMHNTDAAPETSAPARIMRLHLGTFPPAWDPDGTSHASAPRRIQVDGDTNMFRDPIIVPR